MGHVISVSRPGQLCTVLYRQLIVIKQVVGSHPLREDAAHPLEKVASSDSSFVAEFVAEGGLQQADKQHSIESMQTSSDTPHTGR